MSDPTKLPSYLLPAVYQDSNFIEAESQMVNIIERDSIISGGINPLVARENNNNLSALSSSLDDMYNVLSNTKSLDNKLQKQNDVINIIDAENKRLENKKSDIDLAYIGKQRSIQLNESYRLRSNQYIKLIFVVIITISAFIFISVMSSLFPYIPSSIFDVLSIIVISFGLITFYYLYTDMISRRTTDYNELDLGPPVVGNTIVGNVNGTRHTLIGDISDFIEDGMNLCIDSDCCSAGTMWDEERGVCVPLKEKFTTVNDDSYYEFSKYSPI
jgi:hypothetical protein